MTPEDFVRCLTPGVMQPRRYGLDKFKLYRRGVSNYFQSTAKNWHFSDYSFFARFLYNINLFRTTFLIHQKRIYFIGWEKMDC
jgi:hypothetical protein